MSFPDQQYRLDDLTRPAGSTAPQPPRPSRWPLVIAGAAVLALLVGAVSVYALWPKPVSSGTATAPTAAATTGAPAPPATTAAAPTTPAASKLYKLGESVTKPNGASRVTAYAFKQPVAASATRPEEPGYEWAAADVEVCALAADGYTNSSPWRLVYADHTTIEPSSIGYRQFPQPEFPWGDKDLPKDRCVRGWITYAAPKDKRPASIEHSTMDDGLTEWAVS